MAEKQVLVCPKCGREFIQKGRETFCSKICQLSYSRLKRVVSVCKGCGKEFEHENYRIRVFCSQECMKQFYHRKRVNNANNQTIKDNSPEIEENKRVRAEMGLPLYKEGIVNCKLCAIPFKSWDIRKNRHCPVCIIKLDGGCPSAA